MSSLGIYANNYSNDDEYREKRDLRWFRLRKMQRLADNTKVAVHRKSDGTLKGYFAVHRRFMGCRWTSIFSDKHVEVTFNQQNRAGLRGLQTCGSVWACPCCSHKIQQSRASDILEVLRGAKRLDYTTVMITFTAAHKKSDSLVTSIDPQTGEVSDGVWDAVQSGWKSITQGGAFMAEKTKYGVGRYIRITEVTYGVHGWHVHFHVLFLFPGEKQQAVVNAHQFADSAWLRWQQGLRKVGFDAIKESGGLDIRVALRAEKALAEYFSRSKMDAADIEGAYDSNIAGLAREAALTASKVGRKTSRTLWQVLDDIDEEKLEGSADFAIWREYVNGSKGKRSITYSRGLRAEFGMADELTDSEIAEQDSGDPTIEILTNDQWRDARRDTTGLLKAVEKRESIKITNVEPDLSGETTG